MLSRHTNQLLPQIYHGKPEASIVSLGYYYCFRTLVHEQWIRPRDKVFVAGSSGNEELVALSFCNEEYDLNLSLLGAEIRVGQYQRGQDFLVKAGFNPQDFNIKNIDVFNLREEFAAVLPFDVILDIESGVLCHYLPPQRKGLFQVYQNALSEKGRCIVSVWDGLEQMTEVLTQPKKVNAGCGELAIYSYQLLNSQNN